MKRYRFIFLFLLFFAFSCKNEDKQPEEKSENSIDAARNFIRAALDGKFDEARKFMLQDSLNINYMDVAERSYQRTDQSTKDGYRASSINIISVNDSAKDSVTIVTFSNSFKNDPDTLKVIKVNSQWLIDLKYLYQHSQDTLKVQELTNEKIK